MRIKHYTKVEFKCKEVNFIAPNCSLRCTLIMTPNFLFDFKLCHVSKYLKKYFSAKP